MKSFTPDGGDTVMKLGRWQSTSGQDKHSVPAMPKELFVDLKVDLKGVELPPASPYAGKYAGYGITKGKLGLSLDYHIEKSRLDAKNRTVQLLKAGISVISSVNIQYIDELRERVERITGKRVSQTVPRSFLNAADEIVVVDAPPEMCIGRAGGDAPAQSSRAQKLSELREIALLLAADVVDRQLEAYLQRNGIASTFGTQERILVCITPRANAAPMIESGRRNVRDIQPEGARFADQEDLVILAVELLVDVIHCLPGWKAVPMDRTMPGCKALADSQAMTMPSWDRCRARTDRRSLCAESENLPQSMNRNRSSCRTKSSRHP